MGQNFFRGFARNDFADFLHASALDVGDTAKFAQEFLGEFGADAGDFGECGFGLALAAALAVESDGEAVGFVADLLDEMQDRRMMVEDNRFIFLAEDIEDLFFFGDARERLIDNLQRVERVGCGMELADAAVDQDQAGHRLLFFLQTMIATVDDFAHAGEIIVLPIAACICILSDNRQRTGGTA